MDSNLITLGELDCVEIAKSAVIDITDIPNELQTSKFTILTQNIRSIYRNFDDLQINLLQMSLDVDVLILTIIYYTY